MNTTTYTGWIRDGGPGSRWRAVCSAPTRDLCWSALLAIGSTSRTTDRQVCAEGQRPGRRGYGALQRRARR